MFGTPDTSRNSNKTNTPYTPTYADPSVITAGLAGLPAQTGAAFGTGFKSIVGGAGGLGRTPTMAKRSLVGGAA